MERVVVMTMVTFSNHDPVDAKCFVAQYLVGSFAMLSGGIFFSLPNCPLTVLQKLKTSYEELKMRRNMWKRLFGI